jgi:hypothetical protein
MSSVNKMNRGANTMEEMIWRSFEALPSVLNTATVKISGYGTFYLTLLYVQSTITVKNARPAAVVLLRRLNTAVHYLL